MEHIGLTKYSHGGGCGCKISSDYLDRILNFCAAPLKENIRQPLVGNASRDDAALYDLGNGKGLLTTVDFFTPIVDDPFDFGRIAAANAMSDIYAMGGSPVSAIAILGWPVMDFPAEVARKVLQGADQACREAGIVIAGGHSIDNPEPFFGLAVNGSVDLSDVKRNDTAQAGDGLFLTKPLGVGILTTAGKKEILDEEDRQRSLEVMLRLNRIGERLGKLKGVTAMTDVTGFGFLGHLCEMCTTKELQAQIHFSKVPVLPRLDHYIKQGCVTGGAQRNWESYGHKVRIADEFARQVLCDPQTNGGLLVALDTRAAGDFEAVLKEFGLEGSVSLIGRLSDQPRDGACVSVL